MFVINTFSTSPPPSHQTGTTHASELPLSIHQTWRTHEADTSPTPRLTHLHTTFAHTHEDPSRFTTQYPTKKTLQLISTFSPLVTAQHTTCSNTHLVLLKMGIMMPETFWESIDNKCLTAASCWFSLSLHNSWLNSTQFCISYTLYRCTNSLQYSAVFSWKKKTLSKVYILEWLLEITMIYTLFDKVHLKVGVVIYRKALGIDFSRIWTNACRIRCTFSSETWEGPWLFSLHGHPVGSNWW